MENNYYVYMYLREDGTPYYVGKGKDKRAYKKYGRRISPPKDKSKIVLYKQNLTEKDAFDLEIDLIALYGRKDLGTGILYNLTDGGEGASGHIMPEEAKRKISEAAKNISDETRRKFRERFFSEETRRKISEAGKGRIFSEEAKRKISEAKKGKSGKPHTEEAKRKISEAGKGRIFSEEARKKMSEKAKGRILSEEGRRKRIESLKGKKNNFYGKTHSEEAKRKIGEKSKGRILSEEGRKKLSESLKEYYRKKKIEKMSSERTGLEKFFE